MSKGVTLNGAPASPRHRLTFGWAGEEFDAAEHPHGGVVNVLKLTKVQCRAALACISLAESDRSHTVATFPGPSSVPTWSRDSIEALLSEAWADPTLSSGDLMIRVSHAIPEGATARGEPIRMAVAPLRWPQSSAAPWGLLCLLQPLAENFDQDQCDRLAIFADRMVAYFRARQQVLDEPPSLSLLRGSISLEGDLARRSAPVPEPPMKPSDDLNGNGKHKDQRDKSKSKSKKSDLKAKKSDVKAAEHHAEPRPGSLSWLVDEEEPHEVRTEEPPVLRSVRDARVLIGPEAVADLTGSSGDEDVISATVRPSLSRRVFDALEVDPLTGLEGLPGLFGALGTALGALSSGKGTVILTLLSLEPRRRSDHELPVDLIIEAADGLRHHVRDSDGVYRVDRGTFAVVTVLRSGSIYPSNIQERLAKALRIVVTARGADVEVRTAIGCTSGHDKILGPNVLFRQAASALEAGSF